MIRRSFGQTDLTISVIGFGAWAIGGWLWGQQDDVDSIKAIHAAGDAGVSWIVRRQLPWRTALPHQPMLPRHHRGLRYRCDIWNADPEVRLGEHESPG